MKKKHVALLLSAAMVLSLTACGGGSDAPATDEAPAESSGDETAAPEESDASGTEETDSAAAPANDMINEMLGSLAAISNAIVPPQLCPIMPIFRVLISFLLRR